MSQVVEHKTKKRKHAPADGGIAEPSTKRSKTTKTKKKGSFPLNYSRISVGNQEELVTGTDEETKRIDSNQNIGEEVEVEAGKVSQDDDGAHPKRASW